MANQRSKDLALDLSTRFKDTEVMRGFINLLDRRVEEIKDQLTTAELSDVPRLQGAANAFIALRRALASSSQGRTPPDGGVV